MEKDISRTLLLGPLSDSHWPRCLVQTSCRSDTTLYPPLPTLPSTCGPCPRDSELDPEALRGASLGWGHTGCPVNRPSPGQRLVTPSVISRSRSGCVSQERNQVPEPPVGPSGFTAAVGSRPPGVAPGLWCPVSGVHASLQGGTPIPCPPSSSGALLWAQSWSDGFSSLPTQLCGDGSLQPWWRGLPASVVCFQEMWPWYAPGRGRGDDLSVSLPTWSSSPGQCVTLTMH